jgi:hypothetical protein
MMDVESNLMRDKHAMLCSNLNDLIEQLQPASAEEILRTASTDLVSTLYQMRSLLSADVLQNSLAY